MTSDGYDPQNKAVTWQDASNILTSLKTNERPRPRNRFRGSGCSPT